MNMHAGEKSDEGIVPMKGSRTWGQVLHYNIALLDRGGGLECGNARPDPKHHFFSQCRRLRLFFREGCFSLLEFFATFVPSNSV